ncbi:MAG: hypothetical protein AB8F95_05860 [Bacteroidia bacterium]
MYKQIVSQLREIGTPACIAQAASMERSASDNLHLRNLDLTASDIAAIAMAMNDNDRISSVSFSYNRSLGDHGALALMAKLPTSIVEIGLVACGIGDLGGKAILDWVKKSPHLRMVCIEQNGFSASLRSAFQQINHERPGMTLVV